MKKFRYINIMAQVAGQVIAALLSLYITSYVVEFIGEEVYGFVGLANNFVNYAAIVTVALNSMASRFIATEFYQGSTQKAIQCYTTTFFANGCIAAVLAVIGAFIIFFMDSFLNVPPAHLNDIQWLWTSIFLGFLVDMLSTAFKSAAFVTNKLYYTSVATIIGVAVRAGCVLLLFSFGQTKVWYVGLGTLLSMVVQGILHIVVARKLTPQLKIKFRKVRFNTFLQIVKSGIWNTITQLGKLLTEGLDLLITNITIGAQPMGVLSVSKVLSTYVQMFNGTIAGTMLPQLIFYYAQWEKEKYREQLYADMDFMSFTSCLMLIVLYSLGDAFYALWVPSQNAQQLLILTVMSSCWILISGIMSSIFNAFTVENKLRYNAILMLLSGVISTILLLIALHTTNWGIYAVACISSVIYVLKNLIFVIPYAGKEVGIHSKIVFIKILKNVIITAILVSTYRVVLSIIPLNSWVRLILAGVIVVGLTGIVLAMVLLSREKRASILHTIKSKIRRV